MAINPIPLLGGKSVYCINQQQMDEALHLAQTEGDAAEKIQQYIKQIRSDMSRNEQAALAFMLIHSLKESSTA